MDKDYHYDIICLADAPWKYPLWTNKQRIMSRLATQGHRIIYVDPPMGLAGWFKWWRQGRWEFSDLYRWKKSPTSNLTVYAPVLFPPRYGWGRRFNEAWRRIGIKRLAKKLGFNDILLWAYHPDAVVLTEDLPHRFLLYDCVDQYREFPAYKQGGRREEVIDRENRLLSQADAVITTSIPLYEDKKAANPNTFLVENVGDYANFHRAADGTIHVDNRLKPIKRPHIGFVGALDDYKVDFSILSGIAEARPEWSLILVGPVAEGDQAGGAKALTAKKNVWTFGPQPEEDLPAFVKGFDVAIIPYKQNDYTRFCFPLKVYEFLAAGVPVVSTPLPALESMGEILKKAATAEEFVAAIQDYLVWDPKEQREMRMTCAAQNTYESRIRDILDIIVRLWRRPDAD